MKKQVLYISNLLFVALSITGAAIVAHSCSDSDDIKSKNDQEKPQIIDEETSDPVNCQIYRRGEVIPFHYTFTDNVELGNFNIEVHNNFDHHSHSTSAGECELDAKKTPVHPWVYNQDQSIPKGKQSYEASVNISIPTDIDTGDYHFMIRLTDAAGWQQLKAVSIKIVE